MIKNAISFRCTYQIIIVLNPHNALVASWSRMQPCSTRLFHSLLQNLAGVCHMDIACSSHLRFLVSCTACNTRHCHSLLQNVARPCRNDTAYISHSPFLVSCKACKTQQRQHHSLLFSFAPTTGSFGRVSAPHLHCIIILLPTLKAMQRTRILDYPRTSHTAQAVEPKTVGQYILKKLP